MSVWILAEFEGSLPSRLTFELLQAGRELADALGQPLGVLAIGAGVTPFAGQLVGLGADRVVVADHPALEPSAAEPYVELASAVLAAAEPTCMLAGHTRLGVEVAGRLAIRWQTGLVTAVTALGLEHESIVADRPLPDGRLARVAAKRLPAVFTLATGHHAWPEAQPERQGEVTPLAVPDDRLHSRIRLLESTPEAAPPLSTAEVVVAGGLGMGGPEAWPLLERLASMLGGTVGASRGAVEAGWRPASELIGMGGALIAPRVYVACGIEGSSEHLAALRGAPTVIALHPDATAPLMRRAEVAVVGDPREVLPYWIEALARVGKSDR